MALSYKLPKDSTDIVPLKLDMYRSPKAFYSSDNEAIGLKYREMVQDFGEIAESTNTSVTSG